MRPRKYFLVLTSVIFERSSFESRRHHDLRRRRGNKICQDQRANAHNPNNRRHRLDHLPTSEFHNESLLVHGSIGSPSKRIPRSHPLKIISKGKESADLGRGEILAVFQATAAGAISARRSSTTVISVKAATVLRKTRFFMKTSWLPHCDCSSTATQSPLTCPKYRDLCDQSNENFCLY
jgi:hypothetical protein